MFQLKERWHIIESEERRKWNLTRGIDLSSLYPKLMTYLKQNKEKLTQGNCVWFLLPFLPFAEGLKPWASIEQRTKCINERSIHY